MLVGRSCYCCSSIKRNSERQLHHVKSCSIIPFSCCSARFHLQFSERSVGWSGWYFIFLQLLYPHYYCRAAIICHIIVEFCTCAKHHRLVYNLQYRLNEYFSIWRASASLLQLLFLYQFVYITMK